jgi:hypothetical protein
MRQKLLLSTAALLAGMAVASAQGTMTEGAKSPTGPAGHQQGPAQAQQGAHQQDAQQQGKAGQAQRSEQSGRRDQTTGQAGEKAGERNTGRATQAQPAQPKSAEKSGEKSAQPKSAAEKSAQPEAAEKSTQHKSPRSNVREQTTGQSQPGHNPAQTQNRQPGQTEGQAQQRETQGQAPAREQGQVQRQPGQGQPQQAEGRTGGNAALSSEQRIRIRETVLASLDVPRVDNINFSLREGEVVPGNVRVMQVPESFVAIYPQWRDDEYFVVRDDIVIADHGRRIVAVVPMGSSSGPSQARMSGPMNLSQEEIRELQIALNEKGFSVGEPDGRLGPRTNRALMEFQQRQGLQATGHIDQRTVQALGINIREQQGGSVEPSSTGRAGNTQQQPSAAQQPMPGAQQQPGAREPSTSGQSGRPMPQPQANPANPRSGGGTLPREQGR